MCPRALPSGETWVVELGPESEEVREQRRPPQVLKGQFAEGSSFQVLLSGRDASDVTWGARGEKCSWDAMPS